MFLHYALSEDFHDYGISAGPTLPDRSVMANEAFDGRLLPELKFAVNVPDRSLWGQLMGTEVIKSPGQLMGTEVIKSPGQAFS